MLRSSIPITLLLALTAASAFQAPSSLHLQRRSSIQTIASPLHAEKKRRRKRKVVPAPSEPAAANDIPNKAPPSPTTSAEAPQQESAKDLAIKMLAQEQQMFDEDDLNYDDYTPIPLDTDRITAAASKAGYDVSGVGGQQQQLNDIFDASEFLAKRKERQENDANDTPAVTTKKKIKRSDIEAYTRLLEMDPLADEDGRYFEDEDEIDFISALLGDVEPGVKETAEEENRTGKRVVKKTSFLGIGSGPLQLGHFFGSLAIVLCAFVEYPGFPLTNLPDPLRGALQGGLGTVYLINTVLAVLAGISAPSRNQSSALWAAKTFAVGGIAYDQLMQIPTPEEAAEKARREQEAMNFGRRRRGKKGQN